MTDDFVLKEDTTRLADAVLELAKELWIATERNQILETLLVQRGLLGDDEIDKFEPDETLRNRLEAKRQRFVNRLLRALTDDEQSQKRERPESPHDSFT